MTARSLYSATAGLGLFAFTITSSLAFGAAAGPTLVGFGLFTVLGVLEIALLSYAPVRFEVRSPAGSKAAAAPPLLRPVTACSEGRVAVPESRAA